MCGVYALSSSSRIQCVLCGVVCAVCVVYLHRYYTLHLHHSISEGFDLLVLLVILQLHLLEGKRFETKTCYDGRVVTQTG